MSKPHADNKALYPAQQYQPPAPAALSEDERMARALQDQYDREARAFGGGPPVLAQPGFQPMDLPFNCGHCGLPHVVRGVAHNTVFQCVRCGRQNQIAIHQNRPVVVLRSRASWVPIPIFCTIQ